MDLDKLAGDLETEDTDTQESQGEEKTEATETTTETPDPMAKVLAQLEKLNSRIDEAETQSRTQAETQTETKEEPQDPNYGFDPQAIVNASMQTSAQATMILRRVEKELDAEFGDKLDASERDAILNEIIQRVPAAQLASVIDRQKTHITMADALYGNKVRSGKVDPTKKTESVKTPIGESAPVISSGKEKGYIKEFESMYGKVTSKKSLERLKAAAAGDF